MFYGNSPAGCVCSDRVDGRAMSKMLVRVDYVYEADAVLLRIPI
jgi:hypothetical protein